MGRNWTNEQKDAIYYKWYDDKNNKSSNILVSAAAGSGKTAVLVERIINKICSEKNIPEHCDIDELLVVTFTNAAAKEMQQRINKSLNDKLNEANLINDYKKADELNKQISLLYNADITTIDSFCLKVIRNYFHILNIDPNFKIIDSVECEMLKDEAIQELFEQEYKNEEFIKLLSILTDGKNDEDLAVIIRQLHTFIESMANPEKWLDKKTNELKRDNIKLIKRVRKDILTKVSYAKERLYRGLLLMVKASQTQKKSYKKEELIEFIKKNPPEEDNDIYLSFETYYKAFYDEYFYLDKCKDMSWNELYDYLKEIKYINLKTAPKYRDNDKKVKDKEILEHLKELRKNAKDIISAQFEFLIDKEETINEITKTNTYPMILELVTLCKKFDVIYKEKKQEKNALEFSDIEHLCYKLFKENDDIANIYKNKYVEILMDEYQDSNELQEELFNLISRGDNMFMVGDMKQSIYKFRNSEPKFFKIKSESYENAQKAQNKKIILSKNFRSRKEVLDSVNEIFFKTMSDDVGDIVYDEEQQLNYVSGKYNEININNCSGNISECNIILSKNDNSVDDDLNNVELEARFIAKKIKELKDNKFLVYKKEKIFEKNENNELVEVIKEVPMPIENKDIAILMSSHKNTSSIYQKELENLGIDCLAQTGGYFKRPEIILTISLLKTINNPYNDIPLIGVMRSFIFNFSDDELAKIRTYGIKSFYATLKIASKEMDDIKLKEKCIDFLEKISYWRSLKKIMSCDELLWTLYENCNLYSLVKAIYGEEAVSNLRLLFIRAKNYEKSGYKGLFNFIRYIEKMNKKENDLGSAVALGEDSNVVKIMTIHKSKGLEFPVVFLADCSKRFALLDVRGKILFHKDLGFGADYINYEDSYYKKTLQKIMISKQIINENKSEELRKLYVAMTRAKEKLFITAVCKEKNQDEFENPLPSEYSRWKNMCDTKDGKMTKVESQNANRFIDWIAPVAMKSDVWKFNVIRYDDASKIDINSYSSSENVAIKDNNIKISDKPYPYQEMTKMPTKITVSELNDLNSNKLFDDLVKKPRFLMTKQTTQGAERGTLVHYIMQNLNPSGNIDCNYVECFINKLYINEEISLEEKNMLNPQMFVYFYNSEIGNRILKSDKVVKEAPFEMEITFKEASIGDSDEKIILQGIIDCYFYENDEIVLLDYKTDYYEDKMIIKEKYKQQMMYYKKALERICKKRVKNTYLYLFHNNDIIEY